MWSGEKLAQSKRGQRDERVKKKRRGMKGREGRRWRAEGGKTGTMSITFTYKHCTLFRRRSQGQTETLSYT